MACRRPVSGLLVAAIWMMACVPAVPALPVIHVWKDRRVLELREGSSVRRFTVRLGRSPRFAKLRQGDMRTPVGRYRVVEKLAGSRFHRFLGINYPNMADAERAYREGRIDLHVWLDLFLADARGRIPPWNTPLGGRIGIHGEGRQERPPFDWTEGCIAVSNEEIEYLFDRVPIGTPVIIHELSRP